MQVTININDNYVEPIKHWASVSRTLNQARRLLGELIPEVDTETGTSLQECMEELSDIEPFLNHIHQAIREGLRAK